MDEREIALRRLAAQQVTERTAERPEAVVAGLCAVQAQDYNGALWSVGLRQAGAATEAGVEAAVEAGAIVRTWPMRRTLHFVAAADVRWMLALLAPRAIEQAAGRRAQLGISDDDVARSGEILGAALSGGVRLTRSDALAALEAGGVATTGQRGYHLLVHHAQEGLMVLGPRAGKEQTFVGMDDWVAPAPPLERDEALGRLARRYYAGHGPATVYDLVWWAGITVGDARRAVAAGGDALAAVTVGKVTYYVAAGALDARPDEAPSAWLLPGFDEYLLGYRDREAMLDPAHAEALHPGANGVFKPYMVVDGRVAGLWSHTVRKKGVTVVQEPFAPLEPWAKDALEVEAARYAGFLGNALAK